MGTIKFNIDEVKHIVEAMEAHEKKGGAFSATMDMLFDGENFEGGEPLDKNGKTEKQAGSGWWPSSVHMKPEAMVPALILVGDQGVYLVGNLKDGIAPAKSGLIAYALGGNPDTDPDYYEFKGRTFGYDDGTVTVPIDWAKRAIESGKPHMTIKLLKNSISLVV